MTFDRAVIEAAGYPLITPIRPNGSCRCNEPSHPMGEWGYQWDDREHRWLAAEEAEQRRGRRTRSWRDWFRRR